MCHLWSVPGGAGISHLRVVVVVGLLQLLALLRRPDLLLVGIPGPLPGSRATEGEAERGGEWGGEWGGGGGGGEG